MRIATQTSHKKRHKVLIAELHNVPIWGAQTSHFRDTNRTSSLFGLSLGLSEESLEASPLRCRAASSPPFKVHGRGFPPSKPSPPQRGNSSKTVTSVPLFYLADHAKA